MSPINRNADPETRLDGTTRAGEVTLRMPKLRKLPFASELAEEEAELTEGGSFS